MKDLDLFKKIGEHTIRLEGGFVDHPLDKGGPTKYGITMKTLAKHRGVPIKALKVKDIGNLTVEEAINCYYDLFYYPTMISALPLCLKHLVFDMTINHGYSNGIKILQRALNSLVLVGITVDGVLGPKTIEATEQMVSRYGEKKLVYTVCQYRDNFFKSIVANNPSQQVFLKGWFNRTEWFRNNIMTSK